MKEYPWGKGTPRWVRDAAANDSDKSFTVPDGKIWRVLTVRATFTATATVGNRILTAGITDGTNVLWTGPRTGNIAATNTAVLLFSENYDYSTTAGIANLDDYTPPSISVVGPLPFIYLLPGYVLRVWDKSAIDAAADDLTVVLHYVEYDI